MSHNSGRRKRCVRKSIFCQKLCAIKRHRLSKEAKTEMVKFVRDCNILTLPMPCWFWAQANFGNDPSTPEKFAHFKSGQNRPPFFVKGSMADTIDSV